MTTDFPTRRRLVLGLLLALGAADLTLAIYSWRLAAAPQAPADLLVRQAKKLKALEENIREAEKIRDETPLTQKQCEQFENSLFPASGGYSTLTAEIKSIGSAAGVRMEDMALKQTLVEKRNLEEVAIEAEVAGGYRGVMQFLNGLQRTEHFYVVDSLKLASESANQASAGAIKVSVRLKTFFRATP